MSRVSSRTCTEHVELDHRSSPDGPIAESAGSTRARARGNVEAEIEGSGYQASTEGTPDVLRLGNEHRSLGCRKGSPVFPNDEGNLHR